MRVDEFEKRVEVEGRVIIRVEHHKTGTTYGVAKIVFNKVLENLLKLIYAI